MPDPIYFREKILLVKLESTYGTDPSPTGAANAVLAKDIVLTPMEGADLERDFERPGFGADPSVAVDLHMKITFKVELAPSGTAGTAPAWGPLVRACACAETISAGTSVTYNPISSGFESAAIWLYIGATRFRAAGSRGNVKLMFSASGIPHLEFEFLGLWSAPGEAVAPTADLSGWPAGRAATNANTPTFTIAGTDLVLRSLSLDMGNNVEGRFLIGGETIVISDRKGALEMTVEAVPLTTLNPFTLASNMSTVALELVHGTQAGNIATLDVPRMRMQRPSGLAEANNILEWPLRAQPVIDTGDDEWTLTLT